MSNRLSWQSANLSIYFDRHWLVSFTHLPICPLGNFNMLKCLSSPKYEQPKKQIRMNWISSQIIRLDNVFDSGTSLVAHWKLNWLLFDIFMSIVFKYVHSSNLGILIPGKYYSNIEIASHPHPKKTGINS